MPDQNFIHYNVLVKLFIHSQTSVSKQQQQKG